MLWWLVSTFSTISYVTPNMELAKFKNILLVPCPHPQLPPGTMLLALLTRTGFKPISALTKRSFSKAMSTPFLLSPSQLQASLQQGSGDSNQLTILDSSWFMPNSPRRPNEEFQKKRVPGAQFLDLDEVASPHELGLKHMIPSGRQFADACGIDNSLN